MKRNFFSSLCLGLVIVASSCSFSSGGISRIFGGSTDNWSGSTESITYNRNNPQYELPSGVQTLNIKTNEPVEIYVAKMNFGSTAISKQNSRYIVNSGLLSAENSRSGEMESLLVVMNEDSVPTLPEPTFTRKDFAPARDFVPPSLEDLKGGTSGRFASESVVQPQKSVVKEWKKEDTKELWTDIPNNVEPEGIKASKFVGLQWYTKRTATLKYASDICYVWVINDGNVSVDDTKITTLGKKFDEMYPLVRGVFGEESNQMYHSSSLVDIKTQSDTGEKVNIVVYDIEGDKQSGGTLGYFWAKDYYTQESSQGAVSLNGSISDLELTNEGKYFYIDSGFLASRSNIIYSTLAHEFQHMINFKQKNIDYGRSPSTWFNEMLSMVCEDMIQSHLGVTDKDSSIGRLPIFCLGYFYSGITDWLSGSYQSYSYAGAYAFGAYLARNYGGMDLVNKISTNAYVDQASITQALQDSGQNETFETVFEKYAQSLLLDNNPVANAPSFKKSVKGIGTDKYMKEIDIFNLYMDSKKYRPVLFSPDANSRVALRPYGFSFHTVGYTQYAGTVQLRFSSPVEQNEKIYILVQPRKGR